MVGIKSLTYPQLDRHAFNRVGGRLKDPVANYSQVVVPFVEFSESNRCGCRRA
jgi:hypothetical protein